MRGGRGLYWYFLVSLKFTEKFQVSFQLIFWQKKNHQIFLVIFVLNSKTFGAKDPFSCMSCLLRSIIFKRYWKLESWRNCKNDVGSSSGRGVLIVDYSSASCTFCPSTRRLIFKFKPRTVQVYKVGTYITLWYLFPIGLVT